MYHGPLHAASATEILFSLQDGQIQASEAIQVVNHLM